MSVFVDTGVFYAVHDEDAQRHETAQRAFERVASAEFGSVVTSDYVFDETITLVRSRFGTATAAVAAGDRILGRGPYPEVVDLRFVDRQTFDTAVEILLNYGDQPLSFTDAATVALVERHDLDHVLAFDDDFDGVVDRLDPTTVAAG